MAVAERIEHPLIDELMAYHAVEAELEMQYSGQWIIMHKAEVKGAYDTYEDAVKGADDLGVSILDCLIRQVGVEPAIFLSYGS